MYVARFASDLVVLLSGKGKKGGKGGKGGKPKGTKGQRPKSFNFCVSASKRPSSITKNIPACWIKFQQKKEEMGGSGIVVVVVLGSSSSSYLHYCCEPFGLKMPTLGWVANVKGSSWLLVNVLSDYLVWRDFLSCSQKEGDPTNIIIIIIFTLSILFLTVSFSSSSSSSSSSDIY
jgi:hypothetical protein